MFKIRVAEDASGDWYCLVAPDGSEGETVEVGQPATVDYAGATYVCWADWDEVDKDSLADNFESEQPAMVFRLEPEPSEVEVAEVGTAN